MKRLLTTVALAIGLLFSGHGFTPHRHQQRALIHHVIKHQPSLSATQPMDEWASMVQTLSEGWKV